MRKALPSLSVLNTSLSEDDSEHDGVRIELRWGFLTLGVEVLRRTHSYPDQPDATSIASGPPTRGLAAAAHCTPTRGA